MTDLGPEPLVAAPRRRRGRSLLFALAALIPLLLLALWLARRPIAADLIDGELARRGVPARYEVKRIGFRTQRLERLSIGDARSPDLTASWVEVDVRPTWGAPEVVAIRAGGVRLRARLVDGRVRMGAVERLLPKSTGAPFRLPNLPVTLADTRVALATPAGQVTLGLQGTGNLANGFAGQYRAAAPRLAAAGCAVSDLRLEGRLTTRAARPRLTGPFGARRVDCGAAALQALSGTTDITLQTGLDGWRGGASLASGMVNAGAWEASGARGQLDFAGDPARTVGDVRLAALGLDGPQGSARRAELGGRYILETARAEQLDQAEADRAASIRFEGGLSANGVAVANAPGFTGTARSLVGTPLAPLAQALARAGADLTQDSQLRASLTLAMRGGAGALRVGGAELAGDDALLRFAGGEGVRVTWPGRAQVQIDGRLALSGPGVPAITAVVRQPKPGAPLAGVARLAPFEADGSRVVLAPVRFADGRFSTRLEASGPLLGGRVEQATLPLEGRLSATGLLLNTSCAPLTFRSLRVAALALAPATLRLCPEGSSLVAGGRFAGRIETPRLRGTLGRSPVALAATRAAFDALGFRVAGLEARLGEGDRVSRLEIAQLNGALGDGVGGSFSGAAGQVANVPLVVDEASGRWRFARGQLTADGRLGLRDAASLPRFNALVSDDFALTIRGDDLKAGGTLLEPQTRAKLVAVDLRHDLASGAGGADLEVAGVRFAPDGLQPEQVTRLTLGVVADVDGTLAGEGRIVWSPAGVTSSGDFRISAASLSAPFGPVTGLATELRFTDLLGLVTAPDQRLTVATINPGVLVEDGQVAYRLLPGFQVAVESGHWPFAGGDLSLRPTVLDFSEEAARSLTFDIRGLDAARFINHLEFSNINATGIFDGTLPMVFDRDGGRVVGGNLASRAPGGTLSYIGQVSNANLGIWGGIAFDALKAIQYQNMTIALDGRIDGEMVSQIRFAGVSRGTIEPVATGLIARVGGQLASELQRIPFIFNIQIKAPFRGLIAMSRSFDDPGMLIQDRLGPRFEAVQPPASRNKR